jgi:predicted glutamine amidotransferase
MIDIKPDLKISTAVASALTTMNTLGINSVSNHDGFGYMWFDKPDDIYKTKDVAEKFWVNKYEEYEEECGNGNGIFHVRAASGTGTNRAVKDENAHPFSHGNIVLAHNGTLKLKDEYFLTKGQIELVDEFKSGMIDSEKICYAVHKISGGKKLTAQHIKDAYALFTGEFAFLIFDKLQPDKVFVVRGETKKLHKLIIYIDEEPVGTVINTNFWELAYLGKFIKNLLSSMFDLNIKVGIKEIKEETINEHYIGNYADLITIGQITQTAAKDFVKPVPIRNTSNIGFKNNTNSNVNSSNSYMKVSELALKLNLTISELWILSEYIFGKNIQVFNIEEMEQFEKLLKLLEDNTFEGRIRRWISVKRELNCGPLTIYKNSDIQFPFLFSSNAEIEKVQETVRKKLGG